MAPQNFSGLLQRAQGRSPWNERVPVTQGIISLKDDPDTSPPGLEQRSIQLTRSENC